MVDAHVQQLQPHQFGILCRMIIIKMCKTVNNFKHKLNDFLFSQALVAKVFFYLGVAQIE